jgi:putative DNA methylase
VPADWPERNAKLKEQLDSELNGDIEKARKKYGGKVPNRATSAAFVKHLCKYPGSPRTTQTAQRLILTAHADRLTSELTEARQSGKIPAWVEEFKWKSNQVTMQDIVEGRAPRPRVLDMFAGGGSIPLEALRLGCEAYALELNPVAHIIELCTLVYPQRYGKPDPMARGMTGPKNAKGETTWGGLAEEVRFWGKWVLQKVKAEIGDLYAFIPDPAYKGKREEKVGEQTAMWKAGEEVPKGFLIPVAYLWTRTIRCKNPGCGAVIPLVRQTWLCKKAGRYVALKMIAPRHEKRVRFEVVESTRDGNFDFDPAGFSKGGNATCPFCGTVADSDYVKSEGWSGKIGQQMMAVVCSRPGTRGKVYLSANDLSEHVPNAEAISKRVDVLCQRTGLTVPNEPIEANPRSMDTQHFGFKTWGDLFTPRQMLSLITFSAAVREAEKEQERSCNEKERCKIVSTYLGAIVDRLADFNSSLCVFNYTGGRGVVHTFGRQALPMVWDFAETNPFNPAGASWASGIEDVPVGLRDADMSISGTVLRGSATSLPWSDTLFDAVITDPPYYDNVSYSNLSDFFYVWLRRTVGHLYPEHFATLATPKKNEAIAAFYRHGGDKARSRAFYEEMMSKAFFEANRVLKLGGELVVVYAHKTTLGWATLVNALRQAGFMVAEAWPFDTEKPGRLIAQETAALASSIFLVARKREEDAGIGQYEDNVQPELAKIVRERVDTLWDMGITGADLVIAAVGAGLRVFTRYERVEYANGEEVPAEKFLAEVEGVVLETMMAKLFGISGGNVSAVDAASRFYVLWRFVYKTAEIDAGEAIVFTYSQHVELDGPKGLSVGKDALVEKKKAKYRIRDFTERGQHDKLGLPSNDGQSAALIDVLHRILWLIENSPRKLAEFLDEARPDRERLRVVAQTLAGAALSGKSEQEAERLVSTTPAEQAALGKLLANWRNLIESQLVAAEEGLFGKVGR